jgi:hypothetical protein
MAVYAREGDDMAAAVAGADRHGGRFAPWHRWDRNAFAGLTAFAWLGLLSGFGYDLFKHFAQGQPAYPPIVHIHALIFIGWLLLFTLQLFLIRRKHFQLHRRIGTAMIGLAIVMVLIGPATAILVDRIRIQTPGGGDPTFIFIQFSDILAFACLAGAGIALRHRASAHKRLMLLSLLYLADVGYARLFDGPILTGKLGPYWSDYAWSYVISNVGLLALGAYDLATRRRLHPAYATALAVIAMIELGATWMHMSAPALRPVAVRIING